MKDSGQRPNAEPATVKRSGDHWVLVPAGPGEVAVVNATGHYVFNLCDGTRSEDDIARSLAETTGAEATAAQQDVSAYLERLGAAGLLTF